MAIFGIYVRFLGCIHCQFPSPFPFHQISPNLLYLHRLVPALVQHIQTLPPKKCRKSRGPPFQCHQEPTGNSHMKHITTNFTTKNQELLCKMFWRSRLSNDQFKRKSHLQTLCAACLYYSWLINPTKAKNTVPYF